jgi:hypothetical protein
MYDMTIIQNTLVSEGNSVCMKGPLINHAQSVTGISEL